jgi:hypothetical protein
VPGSLDDARAAKHKLMAMLAALAEPAAIGIERLADGSYGLKVNLSKPADGATVPSSVDGVPVRCEVIGRVEKR